ncbi:MAG: hypothetical protein FWE33_00085 [Defluviitaleaceae bacterium]|nr:hypothetical protein [Defluviitaleaceae bacterium]
MSAFEFGNYPTPTARHGHHGKPPHIDPPEAPHLPAPTISEPILAMKIYDSCRSRDCLAQPEIGAARELDGRIIVAPEGAQSAIMEDLRVHSINVMRKEPSPFREGYWDMEIQFVLCYNLRFVGRDGMPLGEIPAMSTYTSRCSLFGSVAQEVALFTDLMGNSHTMLGGGAPFIMVEAKAIPLSAEIRRHRHRHHGDNPPSEGFGEHHRHIFPTIGLFSIVKLYRMVSLMVESRGFVIPPPCKHIMPPNPCDFFSKLDFPLDAFSPPQKREFAAGISVNIPAEEIIEE